MTPGPYPPFYHPSFYSPQAVTLVHAPAQMLPWSFGTNHLMNGPGPGVPLTPDKTSMLLSNIEEWCNKHNLGVEECKGLIKLGFRIDKPAEEPDNLNEATWSSVGLELLHQCRIHIGQPHCIDTLVM